MKVRCAHVASFLSCRGILRDKFYEVTGTAVSVEFEMEKEGPGAGKQPFFKCKPSQRSINKGHVKSQMQDTLPGTVRIKW